MIRLFLLVLSVFTFLGCSVSMPVTEYRLNTNLPAIEIQGDKCIDKSIKISKPFCTTSLESVQMSYMQGSNKMYTYSQSLWADSPTSAIGDQIVKVLRDTKLFKSVQSSKSRTKDDLIMETNIEDFIQYFDEDVKESYVEASLNFTIIDAKENIVISTKNFKSSVKTKSLDANGGVEALNKALSIILLDSSLWLGDMCR